MDALATREPETDDQPDDKVTHLLVWLPGAMKVELRRMAEEHDRSMNSEIRQAIKDRIFRHRAGEVPGRGLPVVRDRSGKLTPDEISEIVERVESGEKQIDLAREFGVTRQRISQLVRDWS